MSAALVSHAQSLLDDLLQAENRPGATNETLRQIGRREGIPFSALWALRYRPPKDVYASTLLKLSVAHEAMCERQLQRYRAAREATDTANPLAAALTRLAGAIAGANDLTQEGP